MSRKGGKKGKANGDKASTNGKKVPLVNAQSTFIKEVIERVNNNLKVPVQVIHNPPDLVYSGNQPNLSKAYLKPVYVLAPHLNFPTVKLQCGKEGCCGYYTPKQWADARIIYGLHGPVYVLQFRYLCNTCGETLNTSELLKTRQCPDIVRETIGSLLYLTHNGGVTREVLNYILNDGLTAKSFEEVQMGLIAFKKQRYLHKCVQYEIPFPPITDGT